MCAIMARHGLAPGKLGLAASDTPAVPPSGRGSGAGGAAQKALQAGCAIASFDERLTVRDGAMGRALAGSGREAVQVYIGSRERMVLLGHFWNCTRRFQECRVADSRALPRSPRRIASEPGRVAIVMNLTPPPPQLRDDGEAPAGRRGSGPGRDMRLNCPPRGLPYPSAVEEYRGLLRREAARSRRCPKIGRFRRAVADRLGTAWFSPDKASRTAICGAARLPQGSGRASGPRSTGRGRRSGRRRAAVAPPLSSYFVSPPAIGPRKRPLAAAVPVQGDAPPAGAAASRAGRNGGNTDGLPRKAAAQPPVSTGT